ncbi:MAG: class I SAM-dependent DNA methyltransferase, partial [Sphingomonadaceae bacterium]|nr:class I SAM-dependent DNA methyltransferase [Sphingomonadaceae bacterium]
VFCLFAQGSGLLPDGIVGRMLAASARNPDRFPVHAGRLFAAMRDGGDLDYVAIDWFDGGLFNDDAALPLTAGDIKDLIAAARRDWQAIDPAIMGTLFERGLDPSKRSQLGAHYTDRAKIMQIVEPVVIAPLRAEWAACLAEMRALIDAVPQRTATRLLTPAERSRGEALKARAAAVHSGFVERLARFRVLDPACGSGNFLYVALKALKDLEHRANLDAEALGLPRGFPRVGPECVLGIEVNPYAAELARVAVWIGEIQWMRANGFDATRNPILRPLDTIECRDAVLAADGGRADWPAADAIVGNPPFLGGKRLRDGLGDAYVDALFDAYAGDVPQEADFVTYWVAQAWRAVSAGRVARAGLVTTNSIRGGANRRVLAPVADAGGLFAAWSDLPWTVEGAAVRVSLVAFAAEPAASPVLDGAPVERINADLTSAASDLTKARRLAANAGVAFMGDTKGGAFDVPGTLARAWLQLPLNPNGRPNSDVLRPWANGMDVTRRPADKWIIDFGWTMSEAQAALYEAPFAHVAAHVRPVRVANRRDSYARAWWRHVEPRQGMLRQLHGTTRFIITARVSKFRLFSWLPTAVLPDSAAIAIARDDDTSFGILHSRFHELWSLRLGTFLGVGNDPRYTPSTTFETFPFPDGLTPDVPAAAYAADPRAQAIAAAAARLDALRAAWLNPPDLIVRVAEVVPGYPDRLLPKDDAAAAVLKGRTLTALYNARPQWLATAHAELDAAVAAAYGWPADLGDDAVLARLFALNRDRAA